MAFAPSKGSMGNRFNTVGPISKISSMCDRLQAKGVTAVWQQHASHVVATQRRL